MMDSSTFFRRLPWTRRASNMFPVWGRERSRDVCVRLCGRTGSAIGPTISKSVVFEFLVFVSLSGSSGIATGIAFRPPSLGSVHERALLRRAASRRPKRDARRDGGRRGRGGKGAPPNPDDGVSSCARRETRADPRDDANPNLRDDRRLNRRDASSRNVPSSRRHRTAPCLVSPRKGGWCS